MYVRMYLPRYYSGNIYKFFYYKLIALVIAEISSCDTDGTRPKKNNWPQININNENG